MEQATINRLKAYLNPEQLHSFVRRSDLFKIYLKNRTDDYLKAYEAEYERFLSLTGGKKPCQLIPLDVWD